MVVMPLLQVAYRVEDHQWSPTRDRVHHMAIYMALAPTGLSEREASLLSRSHVLH